MYLIGPTGEPVLTNTCHYAPVTDIAFPEHSGDIFATASDVDVRIWNLKTCQELLRVAVPNLECKCITFKKDGTSLITGWSDGKIRAFGPQSGRLQYQINDAHKKCVTALAVSDPYNDRGDINIVSGGEGMSENIINRWRGAYLEDHKASPGATTCYEGTQGNRYLYQNP
jgi:WD40 repeat protein